MISPSKTKSALECRPFHGQIHFIIVAGISISLRGFRKIWEAGGSGQRRTRLCDFHDRPASRGWCGVQGRKSAAV